MASWKYLPWLAALVVAAFLHGAVTPGGQAVAGFLIGASFLCLAPELGRCQTGNAGRVLNSLLLFWLIVPLFALPLDWIVRVQPATAELARAFPLDPSVSHGSIPLTLSRANSYQRLWELSLIFSCFLLGQVAARQSHVPLLLARFLAFGLLLLISSDIWLRLHPNQSILGLWPVTTDHAAATFANRNHFANWACLTIVFLLGAIVRSFRPFQELRRGGPLPERNPRMALGFMLIALSGLIAAAATGSRGALLALGAGLLVWGFCLFYYSRSYTRLFITGTLLLAACCAILVAGQLVFARLATGAQDFRFKWNIWSDAWMIARSFPVFGTGLGTFVTAFNHFKTFEGSKTFWHAENDYLEWIAQTGLVGFGLAVTWIFYQFWRIRSTLAKPRLEEPEFFFSSLAALVVFGVQALFDFPFAITANALLASSLAGFVAGMAKDPGVLLNRPAVIRPLLHRLAGLAIIGVSLSQAAGAFTWFQARSEKPIRARAMWLDRSARYWPLEINRQIARIRARVALIADLPPSQQQILAEPIAQDLKKVLRLDPLNWELRLERAWLDLAFADDNPQAVAEAWDVVKLNPRQPMIPLGFARHFAQINPSLALEFIRAADCSSPEALARALRLTWQITHDTSQLWLLTPATRDGLLVLGDFALEQHLFPMAVAAFQRLHNQLDAYTLAKKFLQARRPDLALDRLPREHLSRRGRLLLSEAWLQSGNYLAARHEAEDILRSSRKKAEIVSRQTAAVPLRGFSGPELAERQACELAEEISAERSDEAGWMRLEELARQFPKQPRLRWLLLQASINLEKDKVAAEQAVALARDVLAQE